MMMLRVGGFYFVGVCILWLLHTPLVANQAAAKIEAAKDAVLPTAAEEKIHLLAAAFPYYKIIFIIQALACSSNEVRLHYG